MVLSCAVTSERVFGRLGKFSQYFLYTARNNVGTILFLDPWLQAVRLLLCARNFR